MQPVTLFPLEEKAPHATIGSMLRLRLIRFLFNTLMRLTYRGARCARSGYSHPRPGSNGSTNAVAGLVALSCTRMVAYSSHSLSVWPS
jgi:hypothetical protein